MTAELTWIGGLGFTATDAAGFSIPLNSEGVGVTPAEAVLMGVGGCMGIDVVSILKKQRQEVASLSVSLSATRNPVPPKFFTGITMLFTITGEGLNPDKVQRAIDLSWGTYCSALHSIRPDVTWDIGFKIAG
ncbi:MAG: OsmC family protein [Nitrospinae bacterium]|nr:OsmC family protein [Nitrospinota bacterium]